MIIIISTNLHTSHMIAKRSSEICTYISALGQSEHTVSCYCLLYIHNCGLQNEPHFIHYDQQSTFLGLNEIIYDRTCRNEQVSKLEW
jgi:hypothetical protein